MPGRSIGSVEVQVSGDFSPLRDQARGVFRGLGAQWERDLKGLGKEHAATYFDEFDKETDNRIKRTSSRTWGSFDKENDKNVTSSAKKAAEGFSNTFSGLLTTQFKALAGRFSLIFAGIATIAEPAIVGIAGLASAATALASSGIAGVVGALAPLPAILAALGGVGLTAAFGLKGVGTAITDVSKALRDGDLKAVDEAIKDLSANGGEFVKAFAGINVELDKTRLLIQDRIFAGLAEEVNLLVWNEFPALQAAFLDIADIINDTFKRIIGVLDRADIGGIIGGLTGTIENLAAALPNLLGGFLAFIEGTTPGAERLSALILQWSSEFNAFISRVSADGSLQRFVDGAIDSFVIWADLLGSVGGFLAKVITLGQDFGDRLVGSLTRTVDGWTKNEAAIESFFQTGERIVTALAPIVDELGKAIALLVTPESIGRFEELAVAVSELLVPLAELFVEFSKTGILTAFIGLLVVITEAFVALAPFIVKVGNLIAALLTIITGFISTASEAFSDFSASFDRTWASMISAFETFRAGFQFGLRIVSALIVGFVEDVVSLPGRITSALSGVVEAFTAPFRKAYEAAKGYVDKIKNLPGTIAGGVGNALLPGNPFNNNARGTIVSQATKMIAGEAGREAIIPLTRPLAQIDPSVRAMRAAIDAATIGGQVRPGSPQSQSSGPGTVQNNTWNITESNNAKATAQKVLNRLAASF